MSAVDNQTAYGDIGRRSPMQRRPFDIAGRGSACGTNGPAGRAQGGLRLTVIGGMTRLPCRQLVFGRALWVGFALHASTGRSVSRGRVAHRDTSRRQP